MIAKRKELEVLELTFKRMLHKVPKSMRSDDVVRERLRIYIKLGKERLARQYIKTLTLEFPEVDTLVSNPIEPPSDEEGEEQQSADGEDTAAEEQQPSDAEGDDTTVQAPASEAEGDDTTAQAPASEAEDTSQPADDKPAATPAAEEN